MGPIIVDTSVWIDYIRQNNTGHVRLLRNYVELADSDLYINSTILQEVLQGVREDTVFGQVQANLTSLVILKLDPIEAAIGAASLFRALRRKGVTIRKPNDCLIAHYAIFYDIPILHNDIDFDQIALYAPLRIAVV